MLNLDYAHTTIIDIPTFKRTQERFDWMLLDSIPLATHNANFDSDFIAQRFEALHNAQILSLEHFLNGVLNPLNPIFIIDGVTPDETYFYVRGEIFSEPTYLYTRAEAEANTYMYTRAEFDTQGTDFVVFLSNADAGLETKLENFVESFRPAGKTFQIMIY